MQHDCTLILMLKRQPLIGEKDTVAFFFKGVGGELIIYREQECSSEQLSKRRWEEWKDLRGRGMS